MRRLTVHLEQVKRTSNEVGRDDKNTKLLSIKENQVDNGSQVKKWLA